MGPQGYRLLLQTGETERRPHDASSTASTRTTWPWSWPRIYSHPLGARRSVFAYVGWPGEPAIGPPAFMHRGSADESPVAPLGHHWLDATHISFGTVTAGLVWGAGQGGGLRLQRARARRRALELRAAALRLARGAADRQPRPWLSAQVSAAALRAPEILHPTIDVRRYTASVSYGGARRRASARPRWPGDATSAAPTCPRPARCWPRARRSWPPARAGRGAPFAPSRVADALLAEASVRLGARPRRVPARGACREGRAVPLLRSVPHARLPGGIGAGGYRYELPIGGPRELGDRRLGRGGAAAGVPGQRIRPPPAVVLGLRGRPPALSRSERPGLSPRRPSSSSVTCGSMTRMDRQRPCAEPAQHQEPEQEDVGAGRRPGRVDPGSAHHAGEVGRHQHRPPGEDDGQGQRVEGVPRSAQRGREDHVHHVEQRVDGDEAEEHDGDPLDLGEGARSAPAA